MRVGYVSRVLGIDFLFCEFSFVVFILLELSRDSAFVGSFRCFRILTWEIRFGLELVVFFVEKYFCFLGFESVFS